MIQNMKPLVLRHTSYKTSKNNSGCLRFRRPLSPDLGPAEHADAGGDGAVGLLSEPHLGLAVVGPRRHPLRQQERQDLRPQRKQDRKATKV